MAIGTTRTQAAVQEEKKSDLQKMIDGTMVPQGPTATYWHEAGKEEERQRDWANRTTEKRLQDLHVIFSSSLLAIEPRQETRPMPTEAEQLRVAADIHETVEAERKRKEEFYARAERAEQREFYLKQGVELAETMAKSGYQWADHTMREYGPALMVLLGEKAMAKIQQQDFHHAQEIYEDAEIYAEKLGRYQVRQVHFAMAELERIRSERKAEELAEEQKGISKNRLLLRSGIPSKHNY